MKHSESDLHGMVEHVGYELDHVVLPFLYGGVRMGTVSGKEAALVLGFNGWLNNVALETLIVHARNVSDFLTGKWSTRGDDVCAADYFDGAWPGQPAEVISAADLDEMNKRCFHLSTRRLPPKNSQLEAGR